MSRLIIAIGFMGVASLISFIAGFAFCQWGHQERAKSNESFQAYSAGHGLSIDLLLLDEIWNMSEEAIEDGLIPTQRARRNSFLSAWSTAGTEESTQAYKDGTQWN